MVRDEKWKTERKTKGDQRKEEERITGTRRERATQERCKEILSVMEGKKGWRVESE